MSHNRAIVILSSSKAEWEAEAKKLGIVEHTILNEDSTPFELTHGQKQEINDNTKKLIDNAAVTLRTQHPSITNINVSFWTHMTLGRTPIIEEAATLQGLRADGSMSPTAKTDVFFNKKTLKAEPVSTIPTQKNEKSRMSICTIL
jgi:hypothetical protein